MFANLFCNKLNVGIYLQKVITNIYKTTRLSGTLFFFRILFFSFQKIIYTFTFLLLMFQIAYGECSFLQQSLLGDSRRFQGLLNWVSIIILKLITLVFVLSILEGLHKLLFIKINVTAQGNFQNLHCDRFFCQYCFC